ncbi:MAG: cysteine--tRNA ligase, partial [Chloroflexi bacterium]|nr:cysteine--tRNA ligase [Chloroflexota bacterium]
NSPDAIRLWVLQSHYRSPSVLTETSIDRAETALKTLRAAHTIKPHSSGESFDAPGFRDRFTQAMDDDLNTPRAIAVMFDLSHAINRAHDSGEDVSPGQQVLMELASVLGLTLDEPHVPVREDGVDEAEIERLIEERTRARSEKRWADADAVRDTLREAGIAITDGPGGTTWSRV